jgi:hypothetical protein
LIMSVMTEKTLPFRKRFCYLDKQQKTLVSMTE